MSLVEYYILKTPELLPLKAALFSYYLTGKGVYLHARRSGIEAFIPVAQGEIRGLPHLEPFVKLEYPGVGQELVEQMLQLSRVARDENSSPVEILFHLSYHEIEGWQLAIPEQNQSLTSVTPVNSGQGFASSYEEAIVEVHSHHALQAFFSCQDDIEEQGFRFYAVLGNIFDRPEIRLRLGVYGYHYPLEAKVLFQLPSSIRDILQTEEKDEFDTPESSELFPLFYETFRREGIGGSTDE